MRFVHLREREAPLAAVLEDRIVPLAPLLGAIRTVDELIHAGPSAWEEAANAAGTAASQQALPPETALSAPLVAPSKVVCVGLNYHDHAQEANLELPQQPLLFAKFPSSLVGPDDPIVCPEAFPDNVDWELELAAVVGVRMRHVEPSTALEGVFGYTIANDVSARDVQFSDGQWTRAKSFDSFCPIGPAIVTPDEFGDPQAHRVVTRVNSQPMQDSSTAEMIFGVGEILSYASHSLTLEPGDLVLTGTPAGVGGFRSPPIFLKPGDVVEMEIEGIGTLRNPVVAARDRPPSAQERPRHDVTAAPAAVEETHG